MTSVEDFTYKDLLYNIKKNYAKYKNKNIFKGYYKFNKKKLYELHKYNNIKLPKKKRVAKKKLIVKKKRTFGEVPKNFNPDFYHPETQEGVWVDNTPKHSLKISAKQIKKWMPSSTLIRHLEIQKKNKIYNKITQTRMIEAAKIAIKKEIKEGEEYKRKKANPSDIFDYDDSIEENKKIIKNLRKVINYKY